MCDGAEELGGRLWTNARRRQRTSRNSTEPRPRTRRYGPTSFPPFRRPAPFAFPTLFEARCARWSSLCCVELRRLPRCPSAASLTSPGLLRRLAPSSSARCLLLPRQRWPPAKPARSSSTCTRMCTSPVRPPFERLPTPARRREADLAAPSISPPACPPLPRQGTRRSCASARRSPGS